MGWGGQLKIKNTAFCIVELVSAILQYGIVQSLCHQYEPNQRSLEPDGPLTFGILTILFHFYSFLLFSDPVGSQLLATVDAKVGVLC